VPLATKKGDAKGANADKKRGQSSVLLGSKGD